MKKSIRTAVLFVLMLSMTLSFTTPGGNQKVNAAKKASYYSYDLWSIKSISVKNGYMYLKVKGYDLEKTDAKCSKSKLIRQTSYGRYKTLKLKVAKSVKYYASTVITSEQTNVFYSTKNAKKKSLNYFKKSIKSYWKNVPIYDGYPEWDYSARIFTKNGKVIRFVSISS